MIRAPLLAMPLIAAACGGAPEPQPQTEGQRARAEVDVATRAYGECVLAQAERLEKGDALPGTLAGRALDACPAQRSALAAKVRDFHRIGNPSRSVAYSDAVAEASVQTLESGLRQRAVVVIAGRAE